MIIMTLSILKNEEIRLRDELKQNLMAQDQLMIDKWIKERGIGVGDKIQYPIGLHVKTGILKRFKVSALVYPIIVLDKKDGTPGVQEKIVYNPNNIIKIN